MLQRNLSVTLSINIGKRLIFLGRFDKAQQSLEECWQIRQELVKNNPSSFDALAHLASAYGTAFADVIRLSPRPSTDAIASGLVNYQKMLEIVEPLGARESGRPIVSARSSTNAEEHRSASWAERTILRRHSTRGGGPMSSRSHVSRKMQPMGFFKRIGPSVWQHKLSWSRRFRA